MLALRVLSGTLAASLLLAACGGTPAPPSARSLALRVPGCHKTYAPSGGVPVQASNEVECIATDAMVDVATFSTVGLERQWITAQSPGACGLIQGSKWAALVEATGGPVLGCTVETRIAKALGGWLVSPS
jgi:hypothetical protein